MASTLHRTPRLTDWEMRLARRLLAEGNRLNAVAAIMGHRAQDIDLNLWRRIDWRGGRLDE